MHVLSGSMKLVGWRHSFVCAYSKTSDFCPVRSKPRFQKVPACASETHSSGFVRSLEHGLPRPEANGDWGTGRKRSASTTISEHMGVSVRTGMDEVSVPARNS